MDVNTIIVATIALGAIGLIFAIVLAFLSKKLHIEEDPRVEKVMELLPGLNCGACGFSGCHAYADAVVKQWTMFNGCLPGGEEVNKAIGDLLGLGECISTEKKVLLCHCGAKQGEKKASFIYCGPQTCKAAHLLGGNIDCQYGCIGFGDCVKVCPVNALTVIDQKIEINHDRCIRCGKCVEMCPRNLFELISQPKVINALFTVACNNRDKGPAVRKACSKGCISCGICVRLPNSPFQLIDNLSQLQYDKITDEAVVLEAANKCPTKCIIEVNQITQPVL